MRRRIRNRLYITVLCVSLIFLGMYIILYNLSQNIVFFYPPSQLETADHTRYIRVGGFVKQGSVQKLEDGRIKFVITDSIKDLVISYKGMLPALFREGQGIVAEGKLEGKIFIANELLTKHDENYMPPELSVIKK